MAFLILLSLHISELTFKNKLELTEKLLDNQKLLEETLGRFFPRYFIIFDAIVNGIVSLISLSDSPLLVYGNATDFCILFCIYINFVSFNFTKFIDEL